MAGAVGLILIVASVLKATDIHLFIRQIEDYGIIAHPSLLALIAWGLIACEFVFGVALLVFYRPIIVLPLTALLFLFFIGVTGYGWLTGNTENCGCFGAWFKRSPLEGALEGILLLTATVFIWIGQRNYEVKISRFKAWSVMVAFIIGLTLPLAFQFSLIQVGESQFASAEKELVRLQTEELNNVDLSRGTYFVVLMDTECPPCQEGVMDINMLGENNSRFAIIALSPNDQSEQDRFIETFQPIYPVVKIEEQPFWNLLGTGETPRYFLVRDGNVLKLWDQKIPQMEEIEAILLNS
jgi:hypothetical protein